MSDLDLVINDLRAEGDELYAFLQTLEGDDWERVTGFKNWTITDVVAHLYFGDYLALTSCRDSEEFLAFLTEVRATKLSLVDYTRQWLNDPAGPNMLERWREQFLLMCERFANTDPEERFLWAGPDMGIRMFATARLMETWAHSWEVYDVLGLSRKQSDRISHIATIGAKTYGWTFANRKLDKPGPAPYLSLSLPSGELWECNTPQQDNYISGDAVEFCQVVTQVRNIADTQLEVSDGAASQWMAIAQCFAGPPEQPPAPGLRQFQA